MPSEPDALHKPIVTMLNPDGTVSWAKIWHGYEEKDEYLRGLVFDAGGSLYAVSNSDDIIGSWSDLPVTSESYGGTATPIEGGMYSAEGTITERETAMTPLEIVTDTGGGYSDILVTKF